MNILFIPTTFGLSKPVGGGQTRLLNIVRALKERGHKIKVLEPQSLWDPRDEEIADAYNYREYKLFDRGLFTFFRDLDPGFISKLSRIIKNENIDIIDVSYPVGGIIMAKFLSRLNGNNIPVVYGAHNFESEFIRETFAHNQNYSRIERIFFTAYINFMEKMVCRNVADFITSVSKSDARKFIDQYKLAEEKVRVVSSGSNIVDISRYRSDREKIKKRLGLDKYRIIIFFHGFYSYLPNRDAIDSIQGFIAPEFVGNNDILFLVGGNGVPEFSNSNVKSIGFIENLYEVLGVVDLAIVPLRYGAGTKLKFLDYLSAGIPVVSTKKGSEGIDITNYEHAIVTDDLDDDFIEAIRYLIENRNERRIMGINAHKLAREKYDWLKIGEKLEFFYKEILGKVNEYN